MACLLVVSGFFFQRGEKHQKRIRKWANNFLPQMSSAFCYSETQSDRVKAPERRQLVSLLKCLKEALETLRQSTKSTGTLVAAHSICLSRTILAASVMITHLCLGGKLNHFAITRQTATSRREASENLRRNEWIRDFLSSRCQPRSFHHYSERGECFVRRTSDINFFIQQWSDFFAFLFPPRWWI